MEIYNNLPYDILEKIGIYIYNEYKKRVQVNYDRYLAEKINTSLFNNYTVNTDIINSLYNNILNNTTYYNLVWPYLGMCLCVRGTYCSLERLR